MPQVSVIVPVRNGAATIRRCLEDLAAQDYPRDRFQVIVVDNGSTDATAEICRSLGFTPIQEERPGAAWARNRGLSEATGEVVAFTDADCEVPSAWLSSTIPELDGAPAIQGAIDAVPGGNRFARARAAMHAAFMDDCRRRGEKGTLDRFDTSNVLVWKRVLDEVGGFNPEIVFVEDRELAARVADRVGPIRFVPAVRVLHRHETRFFDSMRKARGTGRMWARLPALVGDRMMQSHFTDVLEILAYARALSSSPRGLERARLRYWRRVFLAGLARSDATCLRHYVAATFHAVRLGAAEALARQG